MCRLHKKLDATRAHRTRWHPQVGLSTCRGQMRQWAKRCLCKEGRLNHGGHGEHGENTEFYCFSVNSVASLQTLEYSMSWKCAICGSEHEEAPLCFGMDAPWRDYVPEAEFAKRVELTPDQCVIDERTFFIRGHIEIPIHGLADPLAFAVWSSLSERSFRHMGERWYAPDRASDPPYFGWLCSSLPVYPETLHLKLSVQSRPPGRTPLFTVEPTEHPLSVNQRNGISQERWHQLSHELMHASE